MSENFKFIHLRVHSCFSLLEGAVKISPLVNLCKEMNMPAVAITDTNNLFGAKAFTEECEKNGIQPIIGTQTCIDIGIEDRKKLSLKEIEKCYSNIVLLAQNEAGYNSIRFQSYNEYMDPTEDRIPHVPYEKLCEYSAGLICLTGGVNGPVGKYLLAGKKEKAEEALLKLKKAFPDRLYMEIQRHGMPDEDKTEEDFIELAYKHDVPLVATNEVFFTDPDMYEAHDALLCIRDKTYIDVKDRFRLNKEYYLKSPEEMVKLFEDLPEAVQNTVYIAKRCGFSVQSKPPALPLYPFCEKIEGEEQSVRNEIYDKIRCYFIEEAEKKGKPEGWVQEQLNARTMGELFEALTVQKRAREGLEVRLQNHVFTSEMTEADKEGVRKVYFERLEYELGVIIRMKFSGYFLIVSDFISWSKKHGIPVGPGRGSGAGSAVAWSLTITDLDPIKLKLLFERFLNPDRVNMPDFDVDFCQTRRGETIKYMQNTYGADKVAQILAIGKMQSKSVLKDVGRVMQENMLADRLAKLFPDKDKDVKNLKMAYDKVPDYEKEIRDNPQAKILWDLATKLEGLYRNASTHAAGVVVGQTALTDIVPVFRDLSSDSEWPVTQFDMKYVEMTGLIKFDFLGLKTLTVIKDAVTMTNERLAREGKPLLEIDKISVEDPDTFALLQRGETAGVFQLESEGMRKVLRDLAPTKFEEVIAVISLYRPGPMDNIPMYIECKKGRQEPDYMHPMLEEILKETYGIMIYQEQVMQISRTMGGYTMGEADHLRKIMGKKKKEEIPAERIKFVDGAVSNGVDKGLAEFIFDKMEKFASYGFNKSHAAAYALVTFQTAFLKAHHPVEFMASTMTYDSGNTKKLEEYKNDLKRMNIPLLPPSVNNSKIDFSVENGAVRYALIAVKGAGEDNLAAIVKEREENGKYKSITDFIRRLGSEHIDKKTLEALIKAGAFDELEPNRGMLFGNVENLMNNAKLAMQEKKSSQISLFGDVEANKPIILAKKSDWYLEKLDKEKEVIGFYLSAHPLDKYKKSLKLLRTKTFEEISSMLETEETTGAVYPKIAFVITEDVKARYSKNNKRFARLLVSDTSGSFDIMVFEKTLNQCEELLKPGVPFLAQVRAELQEDTLKKKEEVSVAVDVDDENSSESSVEVEKQEKKKKVSLILNTIKPLEEAISGLTDGLLISVSDEKSVESIYDILSKERGGSTQVWIIAKMANIDVEISLKRTFTISTEAKMKLRQLLGVELTEITNDD
ncbi:MAG: DNA polymerase III subunit alpha [Alphaproteobacteria bacterium]|nr:DNA polymerase III subunit alpha [Alphaproteobacteria bacterium]